jgi:membrane-associated protease RseP (regulator of RpoE activity)
MKRGLIGTVAVALGVAVLTLGITTLDVATAQETPEKEEQERERRVVRIIEQAIGGSYLGVRISDVDEEEATRLGLSEVHGVLVSEVREDTPAAEAGLQEDDVLVSWNGVRLESAAQLRRHVRETPVGRSVQLGVVRGGSVRDVPVTLGEREGISGVFVGPEMARARAFSIGPEDRERLKEHMGELRVRMEELRERQGAEGEAIRKYAVAIGGRGRLGVRIQNLGDQLAEYFGVEGGALITSVLEDSPAERAGLKAGDVIVGIADEDVEDPGDVMSALAEQEAGPVTVRIVRDRQASTVTVELEERQSGVFCSGDDCEEWEARWEEFAGGQAEHWEEMATHMQEWAEHFGEEWAESIEEWTEGLQHLEWITPHGDGEIRIEGMHLGPFHMDGMHTEPIEMHLDGLPSGEDFVITLPSIDVPAIDIPALEIRAMELPAFDVPAFAAPEGGAVIDV